MSLAAVNDERMTTGEHVTVRFRRGRWARGLALGLLLVGVTGLVGFAPVWSFHPPTGGIRTAAYGTGVPPPSATAHDPVVEVDAPETALGLHLLAAFTNQDAADPSRGCGKAAAGTLLAAWGHAVHGATGANAVRVLDETYPYDVMWGVFGTSPRQMQQMLTESGAQASWGSGEAGLRRELTAGRPVVVLQDTQPDWHRVGLHWTVVYAFDDAGVYLTNWNGQRSAHLPWGTFLEGWSTVMMRGSGVANIYLTETG